MIRPGSSVNSPATTRAPEKMAIMARGGIEQRRKAHQDPPRLAARTMARMIPKIILWVDELMSIINPGA